MTTKKDQSLWVKQIENNEILNNLKNKNIDWKPFIELLQDAIHQLRLTNLVKLNIVNYQELKGNTISWYINFELNTDEEGDNDIYDTLMDLPNFIDDLYDWYYYQMVNMYNQICSVSFELIISK